MNKYSFSIKANHAKPGQSYLAIGIRLLILFFAAVAQTGHTQSVGINTTGTSADASSMLDVSATDKGMLIPRVALTAANVATPVTTPAVSLMVYNTATAGTAPNNVTPGFYYWNGTQWVQLRTNANTTLTNDWGQTGNAGTAPATNFVGTTDNVDFVTRTNNTERMRVAGGGNVAIGTTNTGLAGFRMVSNDDDVKNEFHIDDYAGTTNKYNAIRMHKARGTEAAPVNLVNGDLIGALEFNPRFNNNANSYGNGSGMATYYEGDGTNNLTSIRFFTSGQMPTGGERMRIDPTGNVGIATTAPASRFSVVSNGAGAGIQDNIDMSSFNPTNNSGPALLLRTAQGTETAPTNIAATQRMGSIQFQGYINGLFSPATALNANYVGNGITQASDLRIYTSTLERMRIDSLGNVGIGTNAPGSHLTIMSDGAGGGVADDVTIATYNATPGIGMFYNSARGTLAAPTNLANGNSLGITVWHGQVNGSMQQLNFINGNYRGDGTTLLSDMVFGTSNTERMRIDAAGNVGIGNTAPATNLEIGNATSNSANPTLRLHTHGNAFNFGGVLEFRESNVNFGINIRHNTGTTGTQAEGLYFNPITSGTEGAPILMIDQTNLRVGIGTAAPNSRLDLGTTAGTSATDVTGKKLAVYNSAAGDDFYGLGVSGGLLHLHAGSTVAEAPGMVLTQNGSVGIGTTAPSIITHVVTTGTGGTGVFAGNTTNMALRLENTGNGQSVIQHFLAKDASGTTKQAIMGINPTYSGNGVLYLGRDGSANDFIISLGTGNVGVGTADPDQRLSVSGNASKSGGGTAWAVFSDKRIKQDIRPFTDGLAQVLKINPVFFKYNGKGGISASTEDEVGIIAQEMREVAPYTIKETGVKLDSTDAEGVLQFQKSDAITYMLVNAVKEQQEQIDLLKAQNEVLQKSLQEQRNATAALSQEVFSLKGKNPVGKANRKKKRVPESVAGQ